MIELAVLADDLTGGMIIASKLEAEGVVCPLVTDAAHVAALPASIKAVVLARKIRFAPVDRAQDEARAAAAAFAARGARTLYYKYSAAFDSTDRGNIGPIAEALLTATGAARTMFGPAYIDLGLTVYKGHLFFGSVLASESHKRFDPVSPALSSDLVARLRAQTRLKVGLLDHQSLAGEPAAIDGRLAADADTPFWIADSVDDRDVAILAALSRDWPLVTGGDSLAPAILRDRLGDAPREAGSGRRLLAGTGGGEAVLAGSCGGATQRQLDAFEARHPLWRVDLARDGDAPGLVDEIAEWAAQRLASGPVGICTTADPAGVAAAQAAFGQDGASERADRLMAALAQRLRDLGVAKFVIAGGETSGAVLSALEVRELEVAAYDDLYGGYCRSRGGRETAFVLKPGGMGPPDFFFTALERMREAERTGASATS